MADTRLGLRALAIAAGEHARKVREKPGGRHSPEIAAYFGVCQRGGLTILPRYLTGTEPWCAAGVSWALVQAADPGEVPPVGRIAVRELWADAEAAGLARPISAVRRGEYVPRAGDRIVMIRSGWRAGHPSNPFGPSQGRGHVGFVIETLPAGFRTLEPNLRDAWTETVRPLGDPGLIGFLTDPEPSEVPPEPEPPDERWAPTEAEAERLRELWTLTDEATRGVDGMTAFERMLAEMGGDDGSR